MTCWPWIADDHLIFIFDCCWRSWEHTEMSTLHDQGQPSSRFFPKKDFYQLLQKVTVLEIKIHCLEKMGALKETTWAQNCEKAVCGNPNINGCESRSRPSWNFLLGIKPKNLSGKIQHLDKIEWPVLQGYFPPMPRRTNHQQTIIKVKGNSEPEVRHSAAEPIHATGRDLCVRTKLIFWSQRDSWDQIQPETKTSLEWVFQEPRNAGFSW